MLILGKSLKLGVFNVSRIYKSFKN